MPDRRSCWPRSASRRSRRPAADSPPRWAGPTTRSRARRRSPTRPRSWRRRRCRCPPTSRTGSPTMPRASRETVRGAVAAGLAGCSIEDSTGRDDEPLYALERAAERVAAAVEAADGTPRADRPRGELRRRTGRPRRRDRPAAGLSGGRRGRALRAAAAPDRGHPLGPRVGRPAGQRARLDRAAAGVRCSPAAGVRPTTARSAAGFACASAFAGASSTAAAELRASSGDHG